MQNANVHEAYISYRFNRLTAALALGAALFAPMIGHAAPAGPVAEPPAGSVEMASPANAGDTAQQAVLSTDPVIEDGVSGSFLSSQFARTNGDFGAAIGYLRRVHQKNPANPTIASQLMGMLLVTGKVDEAVVVARDSGRAGYGDPVARLLAAVAAVHDGKADEASAILAKDDTDGHEQLWRPLVQGWLDAEQKKLTKPLRVEELSAPVGNAANIVHYHLGLINSSAGFDDAAVHDFTQAVGDEKAPPLRMMEMIAAYYDSHKQPKELAQKVEDFRRLQPEAAQDKPKLIADSKAGVAEVLFTMGSIMQSAGILQDSVLYLQMALYLKSDLTVAAYGLAESYEQLGLYPQALADYKKIPAGTRFSAKAGLRMALIQDRMGNLKQALAMLDAQAAGPHGNPDALVVKGDLLRVHKHYAEAVNAYSKALKGRERAPQLWGVYYARGGCQERLDKWKEAEADLRTALELSPDQPDALNYLGYSMLIRGGRTNEARLLLEKAVALRPGDPAIIDSMGWALYLAGDYQGAAGQVEKALEIMPNDATIYDHLGDIYWRLGRQTEARYQWERSLTYKPEPSLASAAQEKIRSGLPVAPRPKSSAKAELPAKAPVEE